MSKLEALLVALTNHGTSGTACVDVALPSGEGGGEVCPDQCVQDTVTAVSHQRRVAGELAPFTGHCTQKSD